ncbi:hypothetical protein I3F58_12860 [Streptomyces sp. MUM 203J]|uniref:hypothetical protein n=1 Tax=Streptomyces sp. MUM 203J TaxID=2791990 RepID=UPI001F04F07E|nr:hypothetical protein [Streptomyces sp. MUM 203J]MCH0540444.1 hypothetical protein [Streptomyces sp. MUM 203J]
MRSGLLALRVGAVAATVAAAVPVAVAAEGGTGARVTAAVTPATVAPGGDVDLRVEGCGAGAGTVRSPVFVAEAGLSGSTDGGTLRGGTAVRSTAAPGAYPLAVDCAGRRYEAVGTLRVGLSPPSGPSAPADGLAPRSAGLQVAVPSVAGPDVAGPSVAGPAVPAEQGPGTRHTVIGLVLAAVAAVAVALRGSRRKGPDDSGAGTPAGRRTGGGEG